MWRWNATIMPSCSRMRTAERTAFGPIQVSLTVIRLRHFRTVVNDPMLPGQGDRISEHSDQASEIGVIPTGSLEFASQDPFVGSFSMTFSAI